MAYTCGERPGKGQYYCGETGCAGEVTLDDNTDKLPPCSICDACNWEKSV